MAVLETTTHELGHNLGLEHSRGKDDVMYFASRNKDFTEVTFSATDIRNIQAKYGAAAGGGGVDGNLTWIPGELNKTTWKPGKWNWT